MKSVKHTCAIFHNTVLEQELLVDRASRLVFQTYLRLSKLQFTVKTAVNANSMSPDGTTPLLVFQFRNQPMIWTKFEQLVRFLTKQVCMGERELRPY